MINYKYYLVFIFLFFGCKEQAFQNTKIDRLRISINSLHAGIIAQLLDYKDSNLSNEELIKLVVPIVFKDYKPYLYGVKLDSNGLLIDMWGNPLKIELIKLKNDDGALIVKIWSLGENGKNENGDFDDIAAGEWKK